MDSKVLPIAVSVASIGAIGYNILRFSQEECGNLQLLNLAAFMLSVVILIGCITSDIGLTKDPKRLLGVGGYDMEPLIGPRMDGILLTVASWLLQNGLVGHLGRRPLTNLQGPEEMRDLADQALRQKIPMVFHPIRRNHSQLVTDEMAATATDAVQKGIPVSYDSQQVVGVMDYHHAYSQGNVTPSQMMLRVFAAMEKMKFMNMFVEFDRENVLEQARASDQRWAAKKPLSVFDGVPVSVKDTVAVKGFITWDGKPRTAMRSPSSTDDIMVQRLREAGAIILATTVMTEIGRCPLGYNSHYQGPFNPFDAECYTGGSSSGSVVSVMTGIVPIGLSFDDGGSIRLPAAFCGAFGLAPTFSRVPCSHEDAFLSGNTHALANTATTTDTALAFALLAQPRREHHYSQWFDGGMQGPPLPHLKDFDKISDLSDVRIGVFWDYFNDCDPEVNQQCKEVLRQLENRGAKIVDVKIPHLNALDLAHGMIISTEMSFMIERDFYNRKDLEPGTMIQLALGNSISGVEFLAASQLRGWAMAYMEKLFAEEIDVFVTPGIPITAPRIPKAALDSGESDLPLMITIMRYMFLVNLVGIPGMVVPVGYAANNLPISMQLMADHWNDSLLLRLSHCIEKNIFQRRRPKHFVELSLD